MFAISSADPTEPWVYAGSDFTVEFWVVLPFVVLLGCASLVRGLANPKMAALVGLEGIVLRRRRGSCRPTPSSTQVAAQNTVLPVPFPSEEIELTVRLQCPAERRRLLQRALLRLDRIEAGHRTLSI